MASNLLQQLQKRSIIKPKKDASTPSSIIKQSTKMVVYPADVIFNQQIPQNNQSNLNLSANNSFRSFISHSEASLSSFDGIPGMII
ncbi:unnamed protein product (macronuclear) [Paramecium tetraurelia]|uniref:Uncharacterized protein n=1 Tax=Paramecium tetraurelia TaxID=5888 RepID=A0C5N6_PARTE|nr:uncharacterized protein GSPATT00035232001 [Paramecium tetraurelia]CAK66103.1 unnamed protein product [Paramecium tetraurelia]|eukprot:XP_001433500.1 hypothetical protein (macronuclear) [Paramecium tetraurelia strain d4-2]